MTEKEIRTAAIRDAKKDEKRDRLARSFDLKWRWFFISIFDAQGNSTRWEGNCLCANDALDSARIWAENEGIEAVSLVVDEIVKIPKSGPITQTGKVVN